MPTHRRRRRGRRADRRHAGAGGARLETISLGQETRQFRRALPERTRREPAGARIPGALIDFFGESPEGSHTVAGALFHHCRAN
jgi:hypothetical protein